VTDVTTIPVTLALLAAVVRQGEGFDKGRGSAAAIARARLAPATALVRRELDRDVIAGHTAHGRATRISKRLFASLNPKELSPAAHRRWTARVLVIVMKQK
jgi:hypothetical protein